MLGSRLADWMFKSTKHMLTEVQVLAFFYGGRFAGGNTRTPFYHGRNFAEHEDVVIVTINYRVNIFGFPGGPDTQQNLGLQDQRYAIEWLQANVAAFGGQRFFLEGTNPTNAAQGTQLK